MGEIKKDWLFLGINTFLLSLYFFTFFPSQSKIEMEKKESKLQKSKGRKQKGVDIVRRRTIFIEEKSIDSYKQSILFAACSHSYFF